MQKQTFVFSYAPFFLRAAIWRFSRGKQPLLKKVARAYFTWFQSVMSRTNPVPNGALLIEFSSTDPFVIRNVGQPCADF